MQQDPWCNFRTDLARSPDSTTVVQALFRCPSCATVEYANGTLLSDFATFNDQREWISCWLRTGLPVVELTFSCWRILVA